MVKSSIGRNRRRDHPKGRGDLNTTKHNLDAGQGPEDSRRHTAGPLKSDSTVLNRS